MDFLRKIKDHFVPSSRNVYRPHILRKSWLIFFIAVIFTTEGVLLLHLIARQSALDFVAAVLPGEVVAFTNTERAANNVSAVVEDPVLDAAAQAKAVDMATKGYFSHVSPDGTLPWYWITKAGYDYQYAGENLAVRFSDSSSVVNAWMASPTHRANMVRPQYTNIGIGIAEGMFEGQPTTFVVQYFGTPRSNVSAAPAPAPSTTTVAEIPVGGSPQVAGAATGQSAAIEAMGSSSSNDPIQTSIIKQGSTFWSSMVKGFLSKQAEPSQTVMIVLAAVIAIMVIGLSLTFFVHIQIQPTELLISGAVVAMIAIGFFALNVYQLSPESTQQSAAVFGAMPSEGGFIDSVAARSQR